MSAAFQLDFTGPQTACGYPGCIAGAFHDGEHQFAALKTQFPLPAQYNHVCRECGRRFAVLVNHALDYRTCGSQECILALARREAKESPVVCGCAQRPYPHEVSVHEKVRHERPGVYSDYYDNALRFAPDGMRWPWSLRFAPHMEA